MARSATHPNPKILPSLALSTHFMMNTYNTQTNQYLQYLQSSCPTLDANTLSQVQIILEQTAWESPSSPLDWNNIGVLALVEAEQSSDMAIRVLYLETAIEAFNSLPESEQHPLCDAHLALIYGMIGELEKSASLAFPYFIHTLHLTDQNTAPRGLVYLPPAKLASQGKEFERAEYLNQIFQPENGYWQTLMLVSQAIWRSQMYFYQPIGIRHLSIAAESFPDSVSTNLKLGISKIVNNQIEGFLYLYRAKQNAPEYPQVLQALYLAYRSFQDYQKANYWLELAHQVALSHNYNSLKWQWANLGIDSAFTYISFENSLLMAVEPSLQSVVTTVLIGEGDWLEREIEFWRNQIEPNMTVIDVGANAGVYTFSAALRVGSDGLVLAVEPTAKCVDYLHETCRINQLAQVRVCAGAASDRNGTAKLFLSHASELNEIISDESDTNLGNIEKVECFTLDSLIDREGVSRVDLLKIDAEGHEMQVLKGSDRILTEFKPIIIYENMADSRGCNLPVSDFLRSIGYQLFLYQPYIQQLIPISSNADIQRSLNIIAISRD